MKILMILAVLASSVFITGCNGILGDSVSGVWRGKVLDERSVHYIEMELKERRGKITGTMSILKGRNDTLWKTDTFPIIQSERMNEKVKILVDLDSGVSFELSQDGDEMTGIVYEIAYKNQPDKTTLQRLK